MPRLATYGYVRQHMNLNIPAAHLVGTGQIVQMLSKTLGFFAELERVEFVVTTACTGTSATQTFNVRKGSASGTVCGTVTPTLAATGTIGNVVAGTITSTSGANVFTDIDTVSVERAASGTAFTAGDGYLVLTWRVRAQRKA